MVKPSLLNDLLDAKKVKMFYRSDGWAIIGLTPLRSRKKSFHGQDKRQNNNLNHKKPKVQPEVSGHAASPYPAIIKKKNCWEFMECGRQPGGRNIPEFGICPASIEPNLDGIHGGTNAGRACWVVAGTMCSGKPHGTFAQKTKSCSRCPFYRAVRDEEESKVPTIVLLEMCQSENIITLDVS